MVSLQVFIEYMNSQSPPDIFSMKKLNPEAKNGSIMFEEESSDEEDTGENLDTV